MMRSSIRSNGHFDHAAFWTHGFAVIPGVFTRDEIRAMREAACRTRDYRGDLLSNPLLRHVILDERLLNVARAILDDVPVYFGDSSCLFGEQERGYHKDNADRFDPRAPDWRSQYTLIRFGLYLQDHARHSGGLYVRARSHTLVSSREGRSLYVRTKPGDLVVWNLRTTHSGNGLLLRWLPRLTVPPYIADRLPRGLFAGSECERIALFATFGIDDHHLVRYLAYLKTRAYAVATWRNSRYDDQVWNAVRQKQIVVKDVGSAILHEPGLGTNESYTPIAY